MMALRSATSVPSACVQLPWLAFDVVPVLPPSPPGKPLYPSVVKETHSHLPQIPRSCADH